MSAKIIFLMRTLYACPMQYQGITEKGEYVYIRCRYGKMTISIHAFKPVDNIIAEFPMEEDTDQTEALKILTESNFIQPENFILQEKNWHKFGMLEPGEID